MAARLVGRYLDASSPCGDATAVLARCERSRGRCEQAPGPCIVASGPVRGGLGVRAAALLTHADALLALLEDQPGDASAARTAKAALRARFIAYELPADFVPDLRADRRAVAEATQRNQGETQGGVENTSLIGQLLEQAGREVQELDALIHNKYARQPEKLRAWASASRVERSPQRERKPAAAPTASPTPTAQV